MSNLPTVDFDTLRARATTPHKQVAVRDFIGANDVYTFAILPPGIRFSLDHVRRERHELLGELAVQCDLPGARLTPTGGLFTADFNLSSARARTERSKILADRSQTTDIDWLGYLEEFCENVFEHRRRGDPVQYIADASLPAPDAVIDCDGIPILRTHPMILFGDGGSAKSYLGLYVLGILAKAGCRTLYLDWEFDIHEHRDRLERLFGNQMPKIAYLQCFGTLPEELDRITRTIRQERIQYALLDSIGFACSQPEASESALGYLRATRTLGIGSMHIAHINRGESGDQKPFGSAFWHNGARATWFVKAAEEDSLPGEPLKIGLYHRKANTGRRQQPLGFSIDFDGTRTVISRTSVADDAGLRQALNLQQQIAAVLKHGARTMKEVCDELGTDKKPESLSRIVRRHRDMFTLVKGADGVDKVGLTHH